MCFHDFCSVGQHLVGRVFSSESLRFSAIAVCNQYKCVRAALGTYNAKREELRWQTESTIDGWYMQPSLYYSFPRNFVYEKYDVVIRPKKIKFHYF